MLLLAPLLLAAPLAGKFGGAEGASSAAPPLRRVLVACAAIALATCTLVMRRCIVSNKLLNHLDGWQKVLCRRHRHHFPPQAECAAHNRAGG
jgi:hypothetical protein